MPYTTTSHWTIDELKKLNRSALIGMHKAYLAFVIGLEILFVIGIIISLSLGSWMLAADFVLVLFFLPLALVLITNYRIKKSYESNKILQNEVTTLIFSEDKLELTNERGSSYIKYDELFNILETKTNFYLFISKNQALNVIKENCKDDLIAYLHNLKTGK